MNPRRGAWRIVPALCAAVLLWSAPAQAQNQERGPSAATGDVQVPRRVAVMPATGTATPEELDEVRTAIHNNLSSKAYDLLKPYQVDQQLRILEETEGLVIATTPPEVLARRLEVDGLIFVEVPKISRIYGGAYAHQEVTTRVRLWSAASQRDIFDKTDSLAEREGGVSLNVLGILATAVTSARVLTDGVRQMLVDKLARGFAAALPDPSGVAAKKVPVMELAFANHAEGPFRAGDEVSVLMKAEPGLAATFDIGTVRRRLPLEEKSPGQYVGRYVVQAGDNADNQTVTINAVRVKDAATLEWRVAGRMQFDTVPPPGIVGLSARPTREGVRLVWEPPAGNRERLNYLVERADADGVFRPVGEVAITELLDAEAKPGAAVYYRLSAADEAKNRSGYTQLRVNVVPPGPTRVTGEIAEDVIWHAIGSPYQVEGRLSVLRGATLQIEPGAAIELAPGAAVEVFGAVQAIGNPQGPILWQGSDWTLRLSGTGTTASRLVHARLGGGRLLASGSTLEFVDSILGRSELAVEAGGMAILTRTRVEQAQTGVHVIDGSVRLDAAVFADNAVALALERPQTLALHGSRFERNEVHVRAAAPVRLSELALVEVDYPAVEARLKGPVTIDWNSVPEQHNVFARWQARAWRTVMAAVERRDWPAATEALRTLPAAGEPRGKALADTLAWLAGQGQASMTPMARKIAEVERGLGSGALLWLQEDQIPFRPALVGSDSYLLAQAGARLARNVLDSVFPQRTGGGRGEALVNGHVKHSGIVHGWREGAGYRFISAHVVDRRGLEEELRVAGVIIREQPSLVVGVVNGGDETSATQRVLATLDRYRIRYVSLGQGSYSPALKKRAEQAGVNVLLEITQGLESTPTRLSTSLKQYNLSLGLALYDLAEGHVVERFNGQGSAVAFAPTDGGAAALEKGYAPLEAPLVKALWGLGTRFEAHLKAATTALAGVPPGAAAVATDLRPPPAGK